MNKDFLAMTYPKAEKKLRRAVQICLDQNCTPGFRARLHRDIGIIYVVGLSREEDGKDEFATALTLDPSVAISADMNSDEVEKAFLDVKYTLFPETRPPPAAPPPPPAAATAGEGGDKDSDSSDGGGWRSITNWVSLGFQQDIFFHSKTNWVCNSTRYRCWDSTNQPQDYTNNNDVIAQGNQIPSSTIKAANLRILLGYERLIRKNISIGLKLGLVVSGKAPRVPTDPSVLTIHGEARGSYYFGDDAFEPTKKLRSYVFGALGIAEASSKVSVDIYKKQTSEKVLAWKRAGKYYLGAGVGTTYLLGKNHGPFIEARFGRHMGSGSAFVAAVQAGYNYGF